MQCPSLNVSHNHSAWILYAETGKYCLEIKLNDTIRNTHEYEVKEAEGLFGWFSFFKFLMDKWNILLVATPECVNIKTKT